MREGATANEGDRAWNRHAHEAGAMRKRILDNRRQADRKTQAGETSTFFESAFPNFI